MKKSIFLIGLVLTGCAVHQAPYVTYSEADRPLGKSAVLVAWDNNPSREKTNADVTGVKETDGIALDCFNSCPFWVRVTPGSHTFKIRYQADTGFSSPGISYKIAEIPLTVENMKERHTYIVRYRREGDRVAAFAEDIGENANFGMPMCGMYGDCKTLYRAKFE